MVETQQTPHVRQVAGRTMSTLPTTGGAAYALMQVLPARSVILDHEDDAWQKNADGTWTCTVRCDNTDHMAPESVAIMGPIRLIYRPDVEIRRQP